MTVDDPTGEKALADAGIVLDSHRHVAECALPAGHCYTCERFEAAATRLEKARVARNRQAAARHERERAERRRAS